MIRGLDAISVVLAVISTTSYIRAEITLLEYKANVRPDQAMPAWTHRSGQATESLDQGRWMVNNPDRFSRMARLPSVKDHFEQQVHELTFQWSSNAKDTFGADGLSVVFNGRRLRLFPLKQKDGISLLVTGTQKGCTPNEPACLVTLPNQLKFDAEHMNRFRVRWTTNQSNNYDFKIWINEISMGVLPGEQVAGRTRFLGFEARAGDHVLDNIKWSILKQGTPCPAPETRHAIQQLIKGHRQLFLDRAIVASVQRLKQVVHQPHKYSGNPVIRANQTPWQTFRAQLYGTVLYFPREKKFKMWYLSGARFPWEDPVTKDGRWVCPNFQFTAYAESTDGLNWELPVLGLVEYNGSRHNNICKLATECAEGVAVVYDPDDRDRSRRYKAFYWEHAVRYHDSPVKDINGMSVSFSSDGKNWTEHLDNPVIKQSSDTGQQALWDPSHKVFRVLGRFGAEGRRIGMSESKDFISWTPPRQVFSADDQDGPGVQVYGMGTTLYEGLFIGLPWMFHQNTTEKLDVELAVSRDSLNWSRVAERQVFIPNGKAGEWDAGIIFTASQPLQQVGDKVLIFYSGVQENHGYNALAHTQPGEPDYDKFRNRATASIGVATIRRDGFVSMDAGHQEGSLLTHLLALQENRTLHVNTDVETGELTIDCLDESGHALASTASISGNHVDRKVPFIGSSLPEPGTRVQLRFRITNGKLYSFWLRPTSAL